MCVKYWRSLFYGAFKVAFHKVSMLSSAASGNGQGGSHMVNITQRIISSAYTWSGRRITMNSPFSVMFSLLSIWSPPFCWFSVVSQKLLINKLLCQSLSQKLSFSQGFSVLTICLSSGSISFISNFLLNFFFSPFWLRVQEVLKTSQRKGKSAVKVPHFFKAERVELQLQPWPPFEREPF